MDELAEEFDDIVVAAQAILDNPKLLYYTNTVDFERFQELSEVLRERKNALDIEATKLQMTLNDKTFECETLLWERGEFLKALKKIPNYLGRGNKRARIPSPPKNECGIGYASIYLHC
jgi:hypothetical protein